MAGQFIVEGVKGVEEAMASGWQVERVYALEGVEVQSAATYRPIEVSQKDMQQMTALSSPSPAMAILRIPEEKSFDPSVHMDERLLILDDISDPGNLGTILRTADWFGIRKVILSENCVDVFNPKAVQSTMGSLFRVETYRQDLAVCIGQLKEHNPSLHVIATVMDADPIADLDQAVPGALIIGSEAHGIRPEIISLATEKRSIPGISGAESLNASMAAGILMYAWTR
ncbi:MAG: RNA methyltransferase [Flavobacteriales bacterium]|nr:RNA methyltransferase [Flavobacteriales bacterium]